MNSGKLAIVFDWDDVVFNTAAFKVGMANALARRGVSRDLVLETVGIAKDKRGYNPLVHARMIAGKKSGSNAREDVSRMEKLIWRTCRLLSKKLLFPDAVRTIRSARKERIPLHVLSAGWRRFQETKIFGSGLRRLFGDIRIVDVTDLDAAATTKIKVLEGFARRHESIIFLDDRPKNISAVAKAPSLKGKVLPILVWRKAEKPPRGLAVVRRLNWREIRKIAIHSGFQS